jgi:thiamine-phosphate pyrophosphorylase
MPLLTSPQPHWPSRIMISDADRLPDWRAALARLPRGSGLVLRDYHHKNRAALAQEVAAQCAARGHVFFVGGDAALARRLGARLHAPAYMTHKPAPIAASAAAHNAAEIIRAARHNYQAVLLSPVFATKSHAHARPLGAVRLHRLAGLAKQYGLVCYALGGMNERHWQRLGAAHDLLHGFAAIDAFAR